MVVLRRTLAARHVEHCDARKEGTNAVALDSVASAKIKVHARDMV